MIETAFADHRLVLDRRGVLHWPAQKLLIVSDLHLGKGDSLNRFSNPIPALDTRDTIERLEEAVSLYQPERVVCLGDSFHDAASAQRLPAAEREMLYGLARSVSDWTWVLGNHDPELPAGLPGRQLTTLELEGVTLTHEPSGSPLEIIGHFHPKTSIAVGGQKVTGRCYLQGDRTLMMPSFGSYTGGLRHDDPAIRAVVGTQPRRFLIYRDRVWPLKA